MEILTTFFESANAISLITIIIAGIITLLVGIIGHFLKQANYQLRELSETITEIQLLTRTEQNNLSHLKTQFDKQVVKMDKKIDAFDKSVDNHELRITLLEREK